MSGRGVLILAGDGPRARLAVQECARVGVVCEVLRYIDFLADPDRLADCLASHSVLRIESPDRDFGSLAALYDAGAESAQEAGYPAVSADAAFLAEAGTIGSPAQLFYGLRTAVSRAEAVADRMARPVSHRSADIAHTHDKLATHAHLAKFGIPMPRALGPIPSFETLMQTLRAEKASRVFLKLRHGSAAAGMIALAMRSNGEMRAMTTAILTPDGLRSTRRLQQLTDRTAIAALVDALGPLGLFAERWMPKASLGAGTCDLRIVAVGDTLFPVLRTSPHPMTNLHLGGQRAPVDALRERMPDGPWDALMDTATRTARIFPGLASLGMDIAVTSDFRSHAVLEVNAFGDFVHGLERAGSTPASALLASLICDRGAAA